MARILLLSPDEPSARDLALFLEKKSHRVSVHCERRAFIDSPKQDLSSVDIVILDMSANRPDDWNALDCVCKWAGTIDSKLMTLCLSRVYRGPKFELDVERRGARLVYVR